jgi:hypothetical protein
MRRDRWCQADLLHAPRRGRVACTRCGMNWAVTLVNHGQRPAAYFDRLAGTVEEIGRLRWLLRQVVMLADDAHRLTDQELRARLLTLADRAVSESR